MPEEQLDCLIDLNDFVLDRVGHTLDEFEGLKKKDQELIISTLNISKSSEDKNKVNLGSWNQKVEQQKKQTYRPLASNIPKPQATFKQPIDNSNTIFKPVLQFKHNAIRPFSLLEEYDDDGQRFFPHPYEHEISSLDVTDQLLQPVTEVEPTAASDRPFEFIDTVNSLRELIQSLLKTTEFAVDLEYHNYRSFLGFTCLIQISTRTHDYVIDAIQLRDDLHLLNEPFTDSRIVKVFHGGEWDIQWLQKDFGVYVVRMFDTGQAARLLRLPQFSLFFLAKHYCGITLDKKYQLADWRLRPLEPEMLDYAREDTRSLLYIYDRMRNELIQRNQGTTDVLESVYKKSDSVCLKRFEKPLCINTSYLPIINRSKTHLNNQQVHALKELYFWRDQLAREEDESTGYILPNHMMLKIAEVLPRETQGILACCNPIPQMVKKHLADLHMIILRAREVDLEVDEKNNSMTKSKMTHQLDVSATMDVLDDDHVSSETHECLLDENSNYKNVITLTSENQLKTATGLWKMFSKSDESDAFVSKLVADYESPYQKYLKYLQKSEQEAQNTKTATDSESAKSVVKTDSTLDQNQIMITHSKKRAISEADFDRMMVKKPIKELMKGQTKRSKAEAIESIDLLLKEARLDSDQRQLPMSDSIDKSNQDDKVEEDKNDDVQEIEDESEVDFSKSNYEMFSSNTNQTNEYFDPTKEFLNTKQASERLKFNYFCKKIDVNHNFSVLVLKQKNKSFTSRTKRKKQIVISSGSMKKNKR